MRADRESSFSFRRADIDAQQVGNALAVAAVLEGSVRKDGNRVRIVARLVDASDGSRLWSQVFDGSASEIFSVQREIVAAIGGLRQSEELPAYELFLLGLHYLRKNTAGNFARAVDYFEQAIELDPGYARAYAALSETYVYLSGNGGDAELLDRAESAADYALMLDDGLAESHFAAGHVRWLNGDLRGAEDAFLKAIDINPNDRRPYVNLALIYMAQRRIDAASDIVRQALMINPVSPRLTLLVDK